MNTTTQTAATVTESQAYEALRLAQLHENEGQMASSAKLCAADALARFNDGDHWVATVCALRSLKYSVGIFHPAHATVVAMLGDTL